MSGWLDDKKANGGWLDSYNLGGDIPKPYVAKDQADYDYRNQMYNDSLSLYNNYMGIKDAFNKYGYEKEGERDGFIFSYNDEIGDKIANSSAFETRKLSHKGLYSVNDVNPGIINPNIPRQEFHRIIKPTGTEKYSKDLTEEELRNSYYGDIMGNEAPRKIKEDEIGGWFDLEEDSRTLYNYSNVKPKQKVYPPKKETVNEPETAGEWRNREPYKNKGIVLKEDGKNIYYDRRDWEAANDRGEHSTSVWHANVGKSPMKGMSSTTPEMPSKEYINKYQTRQQKEVDRRLDIEEGKLEDKYMKLSSLAKQGLPAGDNYAIGNFPGEPAKGYSKEEYMKYFLDTKPFRTSTKKNIQTAWLDEQ